MRLAIIDVGSNTIHLLVADCNGRTLDSVVDQSARLRLGADVAKGRAITSSKIALAASTVAEYVITAQRERAQSILLLGTQAVRAASNGADLVGAVERATGLPLTVLSPSAEARLGCIGTQLDAPGESQARLIVDIGGGSTQLSLADDAETHFLGSLPVGSVSLATAFLFHDPPSRHARSLIEPVIGEAVARAAPIDGRLAPGYGTIIGGVGRRLRRAGRLGSGEPLVRLWVERLVDAVMSVSSETLEVLGAAKVDDVDMIRAGSLILCEVMRAYGLQYCLVSNNGIREGAALAMARGDVVDDVT